MNTEINDLILRGILWGLYEDIVGWAVTCTISSVNDRK